MQYEILNVSSKEHILDIYSQMNLLYSEQDHFPVELTLKIAKDFPGLIQIAVDQNNTQMGHIFFIPLNERGYKNMLSPDHRECDLAQEDIFNPRRDQKMFLFVYSIYSKSGRLTKKLVASTIKAARGYESFIDKESIIFTEVVSKKGGLLAGRMGLKKYHTYKFEDEELHLYKSSIHSYVNSFS